MHHHGFPKTTEICVKINGPGCTGNPPPEYTQWSTAGAKRLVAHSVLELEASLNEFQIRIIHAQDDRDVWVTLPTGSRYLFLLAGSVPAKRL